MNEYEITEEQRKEWIIQALTMSGFEEITEGIYACTAGDMKVGVDLTAGVSVYFVDGTTRVDDDNDAGTLKKVSDIIADATDGTMPSKTQPDMHHTDLQIGTTVAPINVLQIGTTVAPTNVRSVAPINNDLTIDTIKRYINDKVTDEEAYVFLQLCKARNLNPFLKEAHLIKYSHTEPATMVVGKDAIMKRAEQHKQYSGVEAGIILESGDEYKVMEEREGTFYTPSEKEHIIGGWAKVYRKDHKYPSVAKVTMSEYIGISKKTGQPNRMWASKPATMIRKVAIVQAMREAFPSDLSGMYDSSEMGVDV